MKPSDLYTIGEVCRICNVNASMLRYYDDIGLVKPCKVDAETGYRYYGNETLLDLPVIYYLKVLGFSLKEIKKVLERENLDLLESLFLEKMNSYREVIETSTKKWNSISSWVELIHETKEVFAMPQCPVNVKYIPKTEIFPLRPSDFHGRTFENLLINTSVSRELPLDSSYTLGALYLHYPDGDRSNWDDIQVGIRSQNVSADAYIIGGYSAVSCYHRGDFSTIDQTVEQMKTWAKDHNFKLRGDLLERSVIDCWSIKNTDWWLMEIYLPIEE
ncbi:MAG: MerR family transcriptional regulator [Firmicutes bacterium]|nr:MerR family transcriptional regulator [Bacillota bacterium]